MACRLADDGTDVIGRELSAARGTDGAPDFECTRVARLIGRRGFRRAALQFPDSLLAHAVPVAGELERATGARVCILADTSYGSCCVDGVAAEHVQADVVVHYGRSCLSSPASVPVIYVLCRQTFPCSAFRRLLALEPGIAPGSSIVLVSDTHYLAMLAPARAELLDDGYSVETLLPDIDLDGVVEPGSSMSTTTRQTDPDDGPKTYIYIGQPSPASTSFLMSHRSSAADLYLFDPVDTTLASQTLSTSTRLRRRYAAVYKAKDAGVIGIVVGTLGISRYLHLINHLRDMISAAGKKPYILSMGKLNPAKLSNFAEIECFVLVACNENSLIESKDFMQTIVTPFELHLALAPGEPPWSGDWLTDFERVMSLQRSPVTDGDTEAQYSFITGRLSRNPRPMRSAESLLVSDTALCKTVRDSALSAQVQILGLHSPAAEHLQRTRNWHGLEYEQVLEAVPAATLKQGKHGIARAYTHETSPTGHETSPTGHETSPTGHETFANEHETFANEHETSSNKHKTSANEH